MNKSKAALIHLSLSILLIGLLLLIVLFIWYPKPFFDISGVIEPIKLLVLIDVIIGPLLTFVVYKQGKKSLKFDLSVIALLQLTALIYGAYILHNGKPSLVVFDNGQFQYMVEKHSRYDNLVFKDLKPSLFSQPKMAHTKYDNIGIDIYEVFDSFEPLNNYVSMLEKYAISVEDLKSQFESESAQIDMLLTQYKGNQIVFFKLNHNQSFFYVAFSVDDMKIIDYLKI
ncbi:MAG: hypothetical protein AB8B80_06100 [Marinicellaceae bacterium]